MIAPYERINQCTASAWPPQRARERVHNETSCSFSSTLGKRCTQVGEKVVLNDFNSYLLNPLLKTSSYTANTRREDWLDLVFFSVFFASLLRVPFRFIISSSWLRHAFLHWTNLAMFDEVQWGGVRRRERRDESEIKIHFFLLSVPLFGARYRTRATEFHREPRVELQVFRQLLLLLSRHSSYRMEFKNLKHLRFQLSRNPSRRWKEKKSEIRISSEN